MSGGPRYWNEDTQRWEDGGQESPSTTRSTSPPPARPPIAPTAPGTETAAEATPPAPASGADEAGVTGEAAAAESSAGGRDDGTEPAPPVAGPGGWPVAGGESVWHGPAGAGHTVVDGGGASPPAQSRPAVPEGAAWPPVRSTGAAGWPPAGDDLSAPPGAPTPWPAPEWSSGASWPPVEPVTAPAPSGGLNRRLVWSVVVGAAVVGVAVSLVLTLVVGKGGDDGKQPVAAGSSSAPVSSPEQSPSPYAESSASPSPSVSTPPDGYELRDDTEGFRIAVPKGWTRSTVPSQYGIAVVNYRSADKEHRLQVYQVQEESPDASFKLYLSAQTRKPAGFEKLDLQRLDDGEFTGSRLEYLAGSISGEPDVGTWHVYDERFVAADGNIYAIASYGPDSDGHDDELGYLATALDWFCPPYTTCDADPGID
ncbi:hypothetical protein [Streptomyces sp. SLBN-31]|uniref:hypothetical protein n=1 Tax=Streptomyces sp. SLBN-31 TaxID=2768444 RepID=UPI001153E00A|nr:hypothetical protein [Streptomyces sp. SLBN-31]TQJ89494.1 hypothetical protein FBY22_0256 [Streptomyces sp. SLBN-31]